MRRTSLLVLGAVIGLFALVVVVPYLLPWTRLNCWTDSIDIASGRYRYERYVLFIKFADRVEETPLSAMYRRLGAEMPQPIWRRVAMFSPGKRYSPNYAYHGSLHEARDLATLLESDSFTDAARRVAIETFLRLLQEHDSDYRAGQYVRALWSFAQDARQSARKITAEQLRALEGGA